MDAHFDPSNIRQLFEQDDAMAATVAYKGPLVSPHEIRQMRDEALPPYCEACRNALLLPLSMRFRRGIAVILGFASAELMLRTQQAARREAAIRRAKANGTYQDWESSDLVAEVSVVAGEGCRMGKEWWFRCPKHDDRTPSLHVNAEKRTWHCFGCQRGGGVVEWRRLIR